MRTILFFLFLAIISNANEIEQPNGQETERKAFEQSRKEILKGNEASLPSNGVENVGKNVPNKNDGKNGKIDRNLGQENGIKPQKR